MSKVKRLPRNVYEPELARLQAELVKLQEWVRSEGARVVVVFEGRDAAGKGSTIKRVTEFLNPRVARIAALPAPTERERTQWYFQRYTEHLPAAGEIVLFDRSWYNRAGVERVMGFCTKQEYMRFLHQCPIFERLLVEDGILLRKYWFSVSDAEQERRFRSRLDDPMRRWKLSSMDLESITRWEDYSRAKDEMFLHTDIPEAPWYVVESEDKRRARINMIAHLLSTIPYHAVEPRPCGCPSGLPEGVRAVTARHADLRARPLRHPARMTSRPGWGEGTRAHRTNPVTSCCTRPKTPGCRSSESAAWDRPTIFPTSRHLGHRQWSRGTGPELETARLPSASALCCGRCDREVAGVQPVVSGYRGTARIPPSLAGRGRGGRHHGHRVPGATGDGVRGPRWPAADRRSVGDGAGHPAVGRPRRSATWRVSAQS
ncbi:polyphosphate kinase 2 [Actinomadura madurae]|uniref:polyphosphate kinase 2 n=1 Tax=Actinomadura madurae TaxID=1993 RepID=UPI0020D24242|nr:polyphosphate kinase 2 [Actinomadura madurae]MCQ0014391.1 polyphosphate kinase 2 [Actinomadura madurae]